SYRSGFLDQNAFRSGTDIPAEGELAPIVRFVANRARTLVGLRFAIEHEDSGVELAVYGTNIFDERHFLRVTAVNGLGVEHRTLGEPRVIGASIKIPFGQ